jgi:serine acetyltransferase
MSKDQLKNHLHECLRREVMKSDKKFSWLRTLHRAIKIPQRRFIFWWRISSYLYHYGNKASIMLGKHINRKIIAYYGTEIELGAKIAPGITFAHHQGVVISKYSIIGESFHIRQNATIGAKTAKGQCAIIIGNNVEVGANTCVISDNITIGNNVKIGAMSYINKNIPDNCIVYTEKSTKLILVNETNPS